MQCNIGDYESLNNRSTGDLNKEHCVIVDATLSSSGRSLKEITCYVPGTVIIFAALCLHCVL